MTSVLSTTEPRVFVSYSHEQRLVARRIYKSLDSCGIAVWIDNLGVHYGHSIRRSIERGLRQSTCVAVLLSRDYSLSYWCQRELDAAMALEAAGRVRIVPIWHEVNSADVLEMFPLMAGRHAVRSTQTGKRIAEAVREALGTEGPPHSGTRSMAPPLDSGEDRFVIRLRLQLHRRPDRRSVLYRATAA